MALSNQSKPGPSKHPKPGRPLGILALIIVGLVAAMVGTSTFIPKLGLDLSGGTTVTLHPVTEKGAEAPDRHIQQAVEIIRNRVNAFGVSEAQVTKQGDNIVVAVPGQEQKELVQQIGQTAQLRFRQVLLFQPTGSTPAPTASPSKTASPEPSTSGKGEQTKEEGAGDSGGSSDTSGQDSDGSSNAGEASAGTEAPSRSRATSAVLQDDPASGSGSDTGSGPAGDSGSGTQPGSGQSAGKPKLSQEQIQKLLQQRQQRQQGQQNTSGIDKKVLRKFRDFTCKEGASRGRLLDKNAQVVACNKEGTAKYVLGETKIPGTMVTKANAVLNQRTGGWMVTLDFNGEGAQRFGDLTQRVTNLQPPRNQVAIVLDGVVFSAPQIQQAILGGQAQITGSFTAEQARDLATILRYGSLPLTFEMSEVQHISASLGASKLQGGLIAGGLGLILVAIYSLLYYRALGIVSVAGLVVAMGLSYAAVVLLGIGIGYRLSLAGIAGLIVAIGITVDSFVVYFERLRDEIREGRSPRAAVEWAWFRARRTILTADTVSFLAAAVLWVLAVGGVKGFAFTLGLTTLIDILVIFIFTKPILTALARLRFFGDGHALSGMEPGRLGARRTVTPGMRGARTAKEA